MEKPAGSTAKTLACFGGVAPTKGLRRRRPREPPGLWFHVQLPSRTGSRRLLHTLLIGDSTVFEPKENTALLIKQRLPPRPCLELSNVKS